MIEFKLAIFEQDMMKLPITWKKWDVLSVGIILLVIGLYFFQYFFPAIKICVCPDFGTGDVWYFNYPVKEFLSEQYREGMLPLWNKDMGMGFPLLAESQIAPFYIPNLLFAIMPTPIVFNIQYVLAFALAGIGLFLYLRLLGFSRLIGVYAGLLLVFSGYFITQINHLNLLQSASLIPFVLLLTEIILRKPSLHKLILLALLLSQQYFAGYAQISFITVIMTGMYAVIYIWVHYTNLTRKPLWYAAFFSSSLILVLALSSAQFLPSRELLQNSIRSGGFDPEYASFYAFPAKHFQTFIDPFALGNPKEGTYMPQDGSFFGENTGYFGILPLAIVLLSPLSKKRRGIFFAFLAMLIVSGVLMMGKHGPAHLVFSIPPFNIFRVPSRFLLMFLISALVLSGIGLEYAVQYMRNRFNEHTSTLVGFLIVCYSAAHLLYIWYSFHPLEPAEQWITPPETAQYITSQPDNDRIIPIDVSLEPDFYYLKHGWQNNENYYYFSNALLPNINLLSDISSGAAYVGNIETRRYDLILSIIHNEETETLNKLLSSMNIGYLVTTSDEIPGTSLERMYQTTTDDPDMPSYYVYRNNAVLPRARMSYTYSVNNSVEQVLERMRDEAFDPASEVILEQEIPYTPSDTLSESTVQWLQDGHQEIELAVNTQTVGILVLADTYYPGWRAFVDGNETNIYPANVNQRAIIVPEGKHTVHFTYKPDSFAWGLLISASSYVAAIIVLIEGFLIRSVMRRVSVG